jgi:PAS domain S-box-containing protein
MAAGLATDPAWTASGSRRGKRLKEVLYLFPTPLHSIVFSPVALLRLCVEETERLSSAPLPLGKELDRSLEAIRQAFGADRAVCCRRVENAPHPAGRIRAERHRKGLAPLASTPGLFPAPLAIWKSLVDQLSRGELLWGEPSPAEPSGTYRTRVLGIRYFLDLPLFSASGLSGLLGLYWEKPRPDPDEEERLALRAYGATLSAALEREDAEARRDLKGRLEAELHSLTMELLHRRNPDSLLNRLLHSATRLVDATGAMIALDVPDGNKLRVAWAFGTDREMEGSDLSSDEGLIARVFQSGCLQVVEDYRNWPHRRREAPFDRDGSALVAPLESEGRVAGILGVSFRESRGFLPEELNAMRRLAALGGVILRSARLNRREAERLRFQRALLEALPLPVFFRRPDGTLGLWNRAFLSHMGISEKDLSGQNAQGTKKPFYHPREERSRAADREVLETRREIRYETEIRGEDGRLRRGIVSKAPVRDEAGAVLGIVGTYQDVTDRVELERRLVQAEKMEALGILAGGFAHNLRNFLTPVLGYAELAQELPPGDPELRPCLREIRAATLRARDMVNQLLSVAKTGSLSPPDIPIELVGTLEETLPLFRVRCPDRIRLETEFPSGQLWARISSLSFQQAILNLLHNGAEAMEDRPGRIVLRIAREPGSPETGKPSRPIIRIDVEDQGCGIPPEKLDQLFTPFYTTKDRCGTGLGLCTVRRIVESCGGGVTVRSEPGRGSCFSLRIPLETGGAASHIGN